jgi:DNA-binding GntR family transcriptional regulator
MVLRRAGKSQEVTHARIVDAIEASDVEVAQKALLDDIESARDAILDGVMEEEAGAWHLDMVF